VVGKDGRVANFEVLAGLETGSRWSQIAPEAVTSRWRKHEKIVMWPAPASQRDPVSCLCRLPRCAI
jgi:hypothetical protein